MFVNLLYTSLIVSAIVMVLNVLFVMRVVGVAQNHETGEMSNLYYIPARIFFITYMFNIVGYTVYYKFSQISVLEIVWYIAVLVFWRHLWVARKTGKNAVAHLDQMHIWKRLIVILLSLFSIFWLVKGILTM